MNQYYRYRGISTGERQTTHYPARVLSCFTCTPLFCVFLTSGEFVNWNLRIWKVSPYIWYVPSAFETTARNFQIFEGQKLLSSLSGFSFLVVTFRTQTLTDDGFSRRRGGKHQSRGAMSPDERSREEEKNVISYILYD